MNADSALLPERGLVSAPLALGDDLLGQVTALRDETESVFLTTGSQLIEISALLDTAQQGALSLDQLASGGHLDRLREEADAQMAVFGGLLSDFERVDAHVITLTTLLGQLSEDLQNVRRSVVMMRMVVLNARVTLATLHARDQRLSNFAEDGQNVVAETVDLLSQFENAVRAIGKVVDKTTVAVRETQAALAVGVLAAVRSLTQDVAGFEAGVRAIGRQGNALPASLQSLLDATAAAVSGLQVGDSTRQQLDHAVFILALPEADDPALRTLAEALIIDAADVHSRTLAALRQDVGRMIASVKTLVEGHLAGFMEASGRSSAPERLQEGTVRLDDAIRALHPLQSQAAALELEMKREFDAFRQLICRGEAVQESTRLIGINAVLSCTRLGSGGLALKVVAEQLQAVAGEVGARFSAMRATLENIGVQGVETATAIAGALRNSIEMPERLVIAINPLVAEVTRHLQPVNIAIQSLQDRLKDIHIDFDPALRHCQRLQTVSANLALPSVPPISDQVDDDVLARIAAIFTIERERDVFRAVLPDRSGLLASTAGGWNSGMQDDGFLL